MTITLTVAGRIATVDATTHVVAGNTYPVTLSLDSEWTGSLYLRVRFGSLYYDIPFASSAASVDVQMPVGYPEVGIGVYSEALEICTCEARVRLLRSILEAGEQVVEFDSDLYEQWAGEVTALLTDDAFDAESTRPVQNAVITAWKNQVEGGAMTIGGAKAFTSPVSVANPTASGHAVNVSAMEARLADGSVTKVGTSDVGSDAKPIKLVGGVPTAVASDLAVDSGVVHKTGNETVAGNKIFTASLSINGDARQHITSAREYDVNFQRSQTDWVDKKDGEDSVIASDKVLGVYSNGYNERQIIIANPERTSSKTFGFRAYSNYQLAMVTPYYPVDGSGNPQALTANALVASGNIAVDPRIVHTTGNETIAGNKTFSGTATFNGHIATIPFTSASGAQWRRAYVLSPNSTSSGAAYFTAYSYRSALAPAQFACLVTGGAEALYANAVSNAMEAGFVLAKRTSDGKVEVWVQKAYSVWQVDYYASHAIVAGDGATSDTAPVVGEDYSIVVSAESA